MGVGLLQTLGVTNACFNPWGGDLFYGVRLVQALFHKVTGGAAAGLIQWGGTATCLIPWGGVGFIPWGGATADFFMGWGCCMLYSGYNILQILLHGAGLLHPSFRGVGLL